MFTQARALTVALNDPDPALTLVLNPLPDRNLHLDLSRLTPINEHL
jgi:hypothetical protein